MLANNGSLRKAFYTGGNSTCHQHIQHHYELYKTWCKEKNIPENHHALPRPLWKQMQEAKMNPKVKTQSTLNRMMPNVNPLQPFTCEGVLHAVAQFITCNDQVWLWYLLMLEVWHMVMYDFRRFPWQMRPCFETVSSPWGRNQTPGIYQLPTMFLSMSTTSVWSGWTCWNKTSWWVVT